MTPHEADLINQDRRKQAEMMQEELSKMGVSVRIAHFTGDSSFPTEYTLTHGSIVAIGPTLDLALMNFVGKLLKVLEARQEAQESQVRQGECVECGRFSSQLTEKGYCEGCVMQAAIDAMEPQERWK